MAMVYPIVMMIVLAFLIYHQEGNVTAVLMQTKTKIAIMKRTAKIHANMILSKFSLGSAGAMFQIQTQIVTELRIA
jgi:hypothetical protein